MFRTIIWLSAQVRHYPTSTYFRTSTDESSNRNLKEENKEEEKTTEEEERGKEASQGNKRNVGTDPMETYIPGGNNYTTVWNMLNTGMNR